ncbi:hypothetical protein [Endozoicomonas sp.]|uniref:hypothetical protein n=1 Tax=Endozoicomonas sp. TaxID=1892382 RepID=UPI002887B6E5|nr:hypothetical protein [Endozoicomonas sp.]
MANRKVAAADSLIFSEFTAQILVNFLRGTQQLRGEAEYFPVDIGQSFFFVFVFLVSHPADADYSLQTIHPPDH